MDGLSADLDEIVADDVSREVERALSGGVALYPRRPKGASAPWLLTTKRRKTSMETSSGDVGAVPPNSPQRRWWNRYVAIGDSLTEGLGDPLPDGRLRGWAARLAEYLRQVMPDLEFVNLAVRGHRVEDAIHRQLRPALALRPDLVSVVVGANDVLLGPRVDRPRIAHALDRLIASFSASGATVIMSTMPDLAAQLPLPPPLRAQLRRSFNIINDVTRDVARHYDALLLEPPAEWATRRRQLLSIDRIHPSATGHRLIAAGAAARLGIRVTAPGTHEDAMLPAALMRRYAMEAQWLVRHGWVRPLGATTTP
jgi:lysophospholipase L1-like esterase